MGNSDHGTSYMRVGGDDGELRPWHFLYEGRRGRWGTQSAGSALLILETHSPYFAQVVSHQGVRLKVISPEEWEPLVSREDCPHKETILTRQLSPRGNCLIETWAVGFQE